MGVIKYLGHSFFEITLTGLDDEVKNIAIDPWVENPLSPVKIEHYRDRKLDYIFITHDHEDHFGNAIELARLTGATIVGTYEISLYVTEKGLNSIGGNIGGPLKIPGIEAILTPAFHSSKLGVPVGVVIKGNDLSIYHAGDTGLFCEMELIGELYQPEIALLPIGGHFTMGIREAAKAVELLKPKIAIPMHYNTFPVIQADPLLFKEIVEKKTNTKVVIIRPGEVFTYPA
ncbi:MAG: metal-dependent hydrolase [Desulfurococcaceae archaeon]